MVNLQYQNLQSLKVKLLAFQILEQKCNSRIINKIFLSSMIFLINQSQRRLSLFQSKTKNYSKTFIIFLLIFPIINKRNKNKLKNKKVPWLDQVLRR